MQKPVLFLDFDGPLFTERGIPHSPSITKYPGTKAHPWMTYWEMDITSVRQLNSLYDIYPFDTVITSSWINLLDRGQIQELFEVNGLLLDMHDEAWCISNYGRLSASRLHMVNWWLEEHSSDNHVASHIILDDPWSGGSFLGDGWTLLGLQEPHIIDPNVGIDPICYNNMKKVVTDWFNIPTTRSYKKTGLVQR